MAIQTNKMKKAKKPEAAPEEYDEEQPSAASAADTTDEQPADEALDEIRGLLQSNDLLGGTVVLFRKGIQDMTFNYVTEMAVSDFEFEPIKRLYGGGDYKIKFKTDKGKYYKTRKFAIDHRFRGAMDEAQIGKVQPTDTAPMLELIKKVTMPGGGGSNDMITMMIESNRRSDSMMATMMTMITKGQENMVTVLTEAFKGRQGQDMTPALVEMIRQKESKGSFGELIEALDAVEKLRGSGSEQKDDMFDKLGKIAGPVIAAFAARGNPAPAAQPAQPPPPAAVEQPAPPSAQGQINGNGAPATLRPDPLAAYVPLLVNAAVNGTDPESYRDLILDVVPIEALAKITEALAKDDWPEKLFGNNPQVLAHRAWFNELRALLIEDNSEPATAEGKKA